MNTVSSAQRYTSGIQLVGSWLGLGTGYQLMLVPPYADSRVICEPHYDVD
jgi:hypothetical protein